MRSLCRAIFAVNLLVPLRAKTSTKNCRRLYARKRHAVGAPKGHFFAAQSGEKPRALLWPQREFCSR
jgi:hypothetical protein